MDRLSVLHRAGLPLFAAIAGGVLITSLVIARQIVAPVPHADLVALGITIDLVVCVPLAFYVLVVRTRRLPIVALAPVLVGGVVAASQLLPDAQQSALRVVELLLIPVEISVLVWIGWRARGAVRMARSLASADPLQRLHAASLEVARSPRPAAILASELAVLYYGLLAWRATPHAPTGTLSFTHHSRSAHASVVGGFMLVMAVEGIAVHLLLAPWNQAVAWILTIGTVYGALWLVADYRATVLRPILITDDELLVRAGFRFTLRIPRDRIATVSRTRPAYGKESADLTFLSEATHWLTLDRPMDAEGPYGFRRRVRAVGIEPDAAAEFERAIAPPAR